MIARGYIITGWDAAHYDIIIITFVHFHIYMYVTQVSLEGVHNNGVGDVSII